MSVSREISIRFISTKVFSDLIFEFEDDNWTLFNDDNSIIICDSNKEKEFIEFADINEVKNELNNKERQNSSNSIKIINKETRESLMITNQVYVSEHNKTEFDYEWLIWFDGFKRILGAERYTDYTFYLSKIVPKLLNLGCNIREIRCHDFDF